MHAILTYFNESLAELRHVRWPTRQQAIRLSVIVIIFIIANSIVFGAVDYVLSEILTLLLSTT